MTTTVLASLAKALRRQAIAYDLDADAIFLEAGLDPEAIQQPDSYYPYNKLAQAWLKLAQLRDNPHIGLQAIEYYRPLDLHALGVAFLSSANLLNALRRMQRYYRVLNSSLEFSLIEDATRIDFVCENEITEGDGLKIIQDCRTALITHIARTGVGESLDPLEVAFTYPQPVHIGDHLGLFRCPLVFNADKSRVTFSYEDSQRPFTAANRDLALGNDQILDTMLARLTTPGLISQVKQTIIEQLPSGTPGEDQIAQAVLMSTRTLSRRLSQENTSFRKLLTDVRRELAEQYIADPKLPITEISFLLGFSDISSFSRAFKRWTGTAPASFRDKLEP